MSTTTKKSKVEVFTAGCTVCEEAVSLVRHLACDSCEVEILDMMQPDVPERAKGYGVRTVPAVVIDGSLASCCAGRGLDAATLKAAGLGR